MNLELVLYVTSKGQGGRKKYITKSRDKEFVEISFFKKHANWDKAVYKAYKQVSNRLGNSFQLLMYSHYENLHFTFTFREGDVEKKLVYEFDGTYLIDPENKKFQL